MKVIISGGRDYKDKWKVYSVINKLNPTFIVVGDCHTGVDKFVIMHQLDMSFSAAYRIHRADWDIHGKAAGPLRNKQMCEEHMDADFLIAFPGGRGTESCINFAKEFDITVLRVE